jgi:hypothetical protein
LRDMGFACWIALFRVEPARLQGPPAARLRLFATPVERDNNQRADG